MPLRPAAFPCCREHDVFASVNTRGDASRRGLADETYSFRWDSTEEGCAVIRIARLGRDAMVFRVYRPSRYGKARRFHGPVWRGAWARLEDTIVGSNFWMLDERGGRDGLDGSTWRFAGRRRRDYHSISRWSPNDGLWAVGLFKTALREVPQADSIYVGYDNGCWLQVRGAEDLNATERRRLQVPAGTAFMVNLVLPTADGELPMRRFFYNSDGNKIEQIVLSNYGYDARARDWYHDTSESGRPVVSAPYLSFSIGSPMITLSAPLHGRVKGVVAIDLKLDRYNEFVANIRPGPNGTTIMFDSSGTLIAHPDFARLLNNSLIHPSENRPPRITDIETPAVRKIIHGWDRSGRYEGSVTDGEGNEVLFRLSRLPLSEERDAYLLLLAAADDFGGNVRDVQIKGTVIAFAVGAIFVPAAWLFGGGMSASLKRITAQAGRLRSLLPPNEKPISSRVVEIQQLGDTITLAQHTILSFARFVPRDIVKGILDGSISTRLGGLRQEVTILFTDVENFTGIAETTDPDVLMHDISLL